MERDEELWPERLLTHEPPPSSSPQSSSPSLRSSSPSFSLRRKISEFMASALETYRKRSIFFWIQLAISSSFMLSAFPASSLLSRVYYDNGGKSKWIVSWVAVAGWPLTAVFLIPVYIFSNISPSPLTAKLFFWYVFLGALSAADNLMYAWAYAYLPASTASLLAASSLAFSALFGYLIDKNQLNLSSLNAIVVITAGATIIALDSDSDRYPGVSRSHYTLGFIWDILGSALHGLIFALSELVFVKYLGRRSFHVVLEQQVMVSLCAFVFTTIGVVVNNDFEAMKAEASNFRTGDVSYYMVLVWSAITYQLGVLGGTAILFLASTLLAGVLNAVRVPITSIAAVIFLNDRMGGFKILSLILTVWGLGSYIVGNVSMPRVSNK
ncbi:putative purine permease 5 [Platanthera zijinensis]|uniref:Probable purine permease n=1 Tax=Platanthera zijinensis TaxID=2320716 RepID=A0AAP0FUQ4_9ASPA